MHYFNAHGRVNTAVTEIGQDEEWRMFQICKVPKGSSSSSTADAGTAIGVLAVVAYYGGLVYKLYW